MCYDKMKLGGAGLVYLSVPLFARFSFGGTKLRGFLDAGFYAGGWLSSWREGTTFASFAENSEEDNPSGIGDVEGLYTYDEKFAFDSRRDNRFEGGALVGVGLEYRLTPVWAVLAECRYLFVYAD